MAKFKKNKGRWKTRYINLVIVDRRLNRGFNSCFSTGIERRFYHRTKGLFRGTFPAYDSF